MRVVTKRHTLYPVIFQDRQHSLEDTRFRIEVIDFDLKYYTVHIMDTEPPLPNSGSYYLVFETYPDWLIAVGLATKHNLLGLKFYNSYPVLL